LSCCYVFPASMPWSLIKRTALVSGVCLLQLGCLGILQLMVVIHCSCLSDGLYTVRLVVFVFFSLVHSWLSCIIRLVSLLILAYPLSTLVSTCPIVFFIFGWKLVSSLCLFLFSFSPLFLSWTELTDHCPASVLEVYGQCNLIECPRLSHFYWLSGSVRA